MNDVDVVDEKVVADVSNDNDNDVETDTDSSDDDYPLGRREKGRYEFAPLSVGHAASVEELDESREKKN